MPRSAQRCETAGQAKDRVRIDQQAWQHPHVLRTFEGFVGRDCVPYSQSIYTIILTMHWTAVIQSTSLSQQYKPVTT